MKKKYKNVKKALKEEEGTGSPYDGYTVKDHKRDMKAHRKGQKADAKKSVKEALKEEEGTGSHYDGYTYKDFKRDKKKKKRAGTGNHPLNR